MIFWTDVITTELWLYSINLAIDVGNNCPEKSGLTALERFSSTKEHARVKRFHTFGSPWFILYPKICQHKLIPKWTPWSRWAIYLGILPQHAGSVALVLNIKPGYISPQFHIIFDEYFTTSYARISKKLPDNWDNLFNNHHELPPEEFQFIIGKKMENPDWPFRGRPKGKPQLIFWPYRGSKLSFYKEKSIPSEGASRSYQLTKQQLQL